MSAGNWPGHHNADGQPMCTCRAPGELLYVDSALHAGFSLLVFLNADVHSILMGLLPDFKGTCGKNWFAVTREWLAGN